jgi:hypothetical protein
MATSLPYRFRLSSLQSVGFQFSVWQSGGLPILASRGLGDAAKYNDRKKLGFFTFKTVPSSVADQGSISRIRIFPTRVQGQKDSGFRIRIRIKEFRYF